MASKQTRRPPVVPQVYWHGTEMRNAYSIMTHGFKTGPVRFGRCFGRGVYVAHRVETAVSYSYDAIIECRIAPSTIILWCYESYDPRVIASLKREFGNELLTLGPDFGKAIPRNKHLTKQELVTLLNYFYATRTKPIPPPWTTKKRIRCGEWWGRVSRLSAQVRRHGYDAIGDHTFQDWDRDQVMLFNPSCVIPVNAFRYDGFRRDARGDVTRLQGPIPLGELKILSEKEQLELDEWREQQKRDQQG